MQSVEASMRLDAVASAGMGLSRGKVKDMIEGGDVLVNWKEVRGWVVAVSMDPTERRLPHHQPTPCRRTPTNPHHKPTLCRWTPPPR